MYHNFFIHLSVDGHLGCFHVLSIVNSVAVNIGVHVSFKLWFPHGTCLVVESLGHLVVLFLIFKEFPYHPPLWLYQITFQPMVQEGLLFSTLSPAFIVCGFFDDGHADRCEVISHCGFDLHFSNNEQC